MLVKLKYPWFAPTSVEMIGNREISGRFYDRGTHDMPNNLAKYLPKSAERLDKVETKVEDKKQLTLKDFDEDRSNSDAFSEIVNKKNK